MTVREDLMEVYEHELKASEKMEALFRENENEDISSECLDLSTDLLEEADDQVKARVILQTCASIGKALGDEPLVKFAINGMEKLQDGQS